MTDTTNKLQPRQIEAARLLMQGKPGVEVAAAVGVTPETISNWKRIPAFQSYINEMHREAYDAARDSLSASLEIAVKTLNELMSVGTQRVRLDAAIQVLKLHHIDDIEKGYSRFGFGH